MLALATSAWAGETSPPDNQVPPLTLGTREPEGSPAMRWLQTVYDEAFRRVGRAVVLRTYPGARLTLLVDRGELDGDVARVGNYGSQHPQQLRVDEPVIRGRLALYAASANVQVPDLAALETAPYNLVHVRGAVACDRVLAQGGGHLRRTEVESDEQALTMLLAGRVDLYCTTDAEMMALLSQPRYREWPVPRRLLVVGTTPYYLYLHRRHAALVPALAAALKQMRAEGVFERVSAQTLRPLPAPGATPASGP